jgi:hypothetical protein
MKALRAIPSTVNISALNIDWVKGLVFFKDISANSTFTFSNVREGQIIIVNISNTSGSDVTLTFPSGIFKDSNADLVVAAGNTNAYTFVRSNGKTIMSFVSKLSNA